MNVLLGAGGLPGIGGVFLGVSVWRRVPEYFATKRDPLQRDVVEDDVFVDEDPVSYREIAMQVNITCIRQLPNHLNAFTIDFSPDSPRVF